MLSIQKLLFLVVIIGVVWYGFKMIGRVQALRGRASDRADRAEARARRRRIPAEDMVLCDTCKTYVAPISGNGCARADCPYES